MVTSHPLQGLGADLKKCSKSKTSHPLLLPLHLERVGVRSGLGADNTTITIKNKLL